MRLFDITPKWFPMEEWECYINGMYENNNRDYIIEQCRLFFNENEDFIYKVMKFVTIKYPKSTIVNFTNKMFNPISWLGQATCNIIYGATESETCKAWGLLTKENQIIANECAKRVIQEWRDYNGKDIQ